MPRTASGMPDERNANTGAERGQIQYDYNKSKQIHSHRQSDCGVHYQNANQPKESGLLDPNENWITDLDEADGNSDSWQDVFESNQDVGGEMRLNGGRISDRQRLDPFHQPLPRNFAKPPKK
jgi:hypothetical protein